MAKLVLFSQPEETVLEKLKLELFVDKSSNLNFVYMPSNGINKGSKKYAPIWERLVKENSNYNFIKVDNSLDGKDIEDEKQKIRNADTLFITGGNTFTLLRNLKRTGMDQLIIDFAAKQDKILAGFSAGALIMTPTIKIVEYKQTDTNEVGLDNLDALGIVPFEVSPHYSDKWKTVIDSYRQTTVNEVKLLTDKDLLVLE